jgi:hypothetical protein
MPTVRPSATIQKRARDRGTKFIRATEARTDKDKRISKGRIVGLS